MGPTEDLWSALVDREMLDGDIVKTKSGPVLEPHRVAAPWLLCNPREAATISAAYDRIYPGALGIPAVAMQGADQWRRWLLEEGT
jgi:hypothetical protein